MTEQLGRLAKSALIYGTGDVLTKIIGFLLLPLFTAYLTPDDYGAASILNVVAFVLTPIFSLGLGTAIGAVYFMGDPAVTRSKTLWTSAALLAVSAALMLTFTALFADRISAAVLRDSAYAPLLLIVIAGTAFNIVSVPFSLYYQFEQKAALYTALSLTSALLSLSLSVMAVSGLRLGLIGWLGAVLIGQGVTLLLYAIPAMLRVPVRIDAAVGTALLKMGIPLVPAFAFLFIIQQSNRLFLERLSGLEAVGLYAVGSNLGMAINLIVQGFTRAWTPYFLAYMEKQAEAQTLFGRITSYYMIGGGAITLCFFLFARPITLIMTAPAFRDAYTVIGLVATAQFLTGLFSVLLPAIYFAQQVRYQTLIQAGAAVVTVAACLLAIPPLGAPGAALAFALGTLAMCALTHLWNVRHRAYFHTAYETERLARFSLFFVIAAALSLIPRDFSVQIELALALIGALILFGFTYTLLYASEKQRVKAALRRAVHVLHPVT
jgi:O-antigen/teichoic acid export membrane protein